MASSDITGGAGIAAYRLHNALLNHGVDSEMLVQKKTSDDYTVLGPETIGQKIIGLGRPLMEQLPVRKYSQRNGTLFTPSWLPFSNIVNKINKINPDLVHLHWIGGGMMRIEDILRITAPIVWTLHDNWPFTGGCHIMWDCEKYKDSCGACPCLGSDKDGDLSRKVFNRKQKVLSKISDITIVGVSKWITKCSENSALLGNKKHVTIPNPLDTNLYKPLDKKNARRLLNLPHNKKLVLFGANNSDSDINKGFSKLFESLNLLDGDDIELVVFGASKPKTDQGFRYKTHYLGHVYDDVSLVAIYSAADVMVVPSLQESFGQTASESMACKTPVVAFGHTGLLDIIDHKVNGYLATPMDTYDLASGISFILEAENYLELCQNSRNKVLCKFDSKLIATKFVDLYDQILQ
ncbi:glycosyltransferase family 4 protein [Planktomarina temperata]|nr:glycosyltransferase family 4 protein [Planktomarina temperata]